MSQEGKRRARALAAPAEDWGLIPSPHIEVHTMTPGSGESHPLFWPLKVPSMQMLHRQTPIHINK